MSRLLWRIATDTRTYTADDMTGAGAKLTGGRWNDVNLTLVYASESRALACLETVVHLNAGGLPLNRYLVEIGVPDDLFAAAQVAEPSTLPVGWDAEPAGLASVRYGSAWIASARSALLMVPSVIVPEERNALINTNHPDAARLRVRKVRKWLYDPRLQRRASA